jgi:hypothetical protein
MRLASRSHFRAAMGVQTNSPEEEEEEEEKEEEEEEEEVLRVTALQWPQGPPTKTLYYSRHHRSATWSSSGPAQWAGVGHAVLRLAVHRRRRLRPRAPHAHTGEPGHHQ